MKDLGNIQNILGTQVTAIKGMCTMSQRHFIENLLQHHGILQNRNYSTRYVPISPSTILTQDDCPKTPEDINFMKDKPFRQLLGALLWLAANKRPDIMYAVTYIAKFTQNPGRHWCMLWNRY